MFFVSITTPTQYDVHRYGYEEDEDSLQTGHIFALITGEAIGSHYIKEGVVKSHYRVKKNLGSRLEKVDLNKATSGTIILKYRDGDICKSDRYKSSVELICDMTENASGKLEQVPSNDSTL